MRLTDPTAAMLVVDDGSRRYLEPLLEGERTVTDLARIVNVHQSSVLYRLRQLLSHGLVKVSRVSARRGRPVKHYVAAADGFFVPFAVTPFVSQDTIASGAFRRLEALLERSIGTAWTEAAADLGPLGLHFYRGQNGVSFDLAPETVGAPPRPFFTSLLGEDAPAVWDSLSTLRLPRGKAKALQRELAGLVARYREPGVATTGAEYLVRIGMAPLASTVTDESG